MSFAPKTDAPPMTLRAGSAADDHRQQPEFDLVLDAPTPPYLESYSWGLPHLDAQSWRHYVPTFIEHAKRNRSNPASIAVENFLASLRPPDRDPPRLASLKGAEREAVISLLDDLAFGDASAWTDAARLALEEYWAPGALYEA